ncbi:MotA/TolQ/ExbB proton channel family protein [Roseibacillus persicicus]|uniref:Flagellar motor protein MotA n=1 Tax=Roseibacillus persicicus TaxID=454148 RepID=A0A918TVY9_9BACT|nr:MotA/TolQ/ExbB proton channel family protein [Roseibacillus persicicus]GHC64135.1 flagellar motor protein MotA [Roseibacillus persicicus]
MKRLSIFFALLAGVPAGVSAEISSGEALVKAQNNLKSAQQEFLQMQQAIAQEESPLVVQVQTLEEELRLREKKLKEAEAQEQLVAGKEKKLDNELANRRGEFDYTTNVLDGYAKGFLNRVQPAEVQLYQDRVEKLRDDAANEQDLAKEMEARLAALTLGAQRLQAIAGGQRFEGRGLVGSDFVNGDFAVMGPVGYFAAKGKDQAGLTGLASNGFPQISLFEGPEAESMKALVTTGSATLPIDSTSGKALKAKNETPTLGDRIKDGGVVGYAILGLGAVALLIALFKFIEITNFTIPSRKKVNEIVDSLLDRDQEKALSQAKGIKGLSGTMVAAGVENFYGKRRVLEDALLEKLSAIQPRLERFLPFLALVAAAAPMMGLLGTVLGIMKTFDAMAIYGTGNAQNFSKGIGAALVTTAQGLVVAIPIIIVHGMLKSLARARFDTAQGVALAVLNGTTELAEGTTPKPSGGDDSDDGEEFEEKELAA